MRQSFSWTVAQHAELSHEVNAVIADAPIVEGSICAVVEAAGGGDLDSVLKSAEESREASKL
ncbi:MAG: hypothetical protein IJS28_02640 [Synergistaceae bacterium]|nr:hypothetical protein [Synergistaceae bacterium]